MDEDGVGDIISFGYWVQQRRLALELTRPALARRVGCSPVTVKKIERDERRPSRQIAELLADQLLIPDEDRGKFIRLARGEFVTPSMPSPAFISLPAFLRTPDEAEKWVETPCVARDRELAQLDTYLTAAVAGDGCVAFITGEAGNGKTLLAREFARQAQDRHPNLIVATGNCNAHTGIGDPYLPFREILVQLTGDIETRWLAGGLSRTAARRLWSTVPHTVKALVEVGPDLVDIFVSGPPLVTRAIAATPGDRDTLAQLKRLAGRHQTAPGPTHLQQGDLFAQYTRVLHMLARQEPLLLILDDLQWADAGSISLLFHLGRQLKGQRILVVGLYRPADVALGRPSTGSGERERHPLEPVVNELQRHFGNIQVELRQSGGSKQLVEAFLDTEPNRLGVGFRDALYRQTGGHPLFTVEMFRGLQARGDLIQNEQGHWIEGPVLDWTTLPARVEGVINERISRLPLMLQEVLKVASVEGEVFTAEVVARVQAIDERHMISQLSHVLDRQQQLVGVQGSQQLETKRLSRYRFRHILFQKFIYDSLDQVERVYLHRAVGNELEQLHAEQVDAVASQLARHFAACGDDRHALKYFAVAGDAAASVYANAEAVEHYTRALELARRDEASSEELAQLYTSLGRALELNSQFNLALANYEEMEKLAHKRGDRPLRLASLTARVTLYATSTPIYDPVRAEALAEQALTLAHDLGDKAAEAKILWNLLFVYRAANKLSKAIECGERSLALARTLDLREQMAFTLNDLGSQCYFINGSFNQARLALQEANGLWRELNNLPMLANSLASSCAVCVYTGEYDQALTLSEEAFQINQSINNLWGQSHSRYKVGYAYWDRGQPDRAITVMEECIRLSELAGFIAPQIITRADLAVVCGGLGAIERGLETAQLALASAETQFPIVQVYVLGVLAHIHVLNGNLLEAETAVDQGKNDRNREAVPTFFVLVRLAEGELALRQGDHERAQTVTDDLLGDLRRFGMRAYIPQVLYLQGQALLGLGQDDAARNLWLKALTEAEAIGSRRMLWQTLAALSQLETDPTRAEPLHQQARENVEYIAHHIQTPELRTSFLNLHQVRVVRSA